MRDRRSAGQRRRTIRAAAAACLLVAALIGGLAPAEAKVRPPRVVPAWYMTATNVKDLVSQATHNACVFAKRQPKAPRLMLLDFGAARKYRDGTFGASLREIRRFRNAGILKALKAASRSYHRCHRKGAATIAYGNTNSIPDYMSKADAREAGQHQALTVTRLHRFQKKDHHYRHQAAAAAGDIEPGFGFPGVTKALVGGANGGVPYYDFGNAGGCPGQPGSQGCYNGWDLGDLGEVSIGGRSLPLPEIYRPYEASQWARVQRQWHGPYAFAGVTGAPIEPLSPAQGWRLLKRSADHVGRELVSIRNTGSRQATAGRDRSAPSRTLGAPMTGTIPAHLAPGSEGFFSTSLIYPVRNAWVASDHRRFVAVEAGADPVDPSTGVIGIFRQDYVHVSQTQRLIRVPDAGALRITAAPAGRRAALTHVGTTLHFTGENGASGTLDLEGGRVEVDSAAGGSP